MIATDDRLSPLSPEHVLFLSERFRRVERQEAAPGHRGRYAIVRQGGAVLGLVAVDAELAIWYSPSLEDLAELRRQGFSYSRGNLLASLYLDLLCPAAPPPPAAVVTPAPVAAAAPPRLLRMPRLQALLPAVAGGGRGERERDEREREGEALGVALAQAG